MRTQEGIEIYDLFAYVIASFHAYNAEFIARKLKVKENEQYETFEVDGDDESIILQGESPGTSPTNPSGIESEDDPFDYAALY